MHVAAILVQAKSLEPVVKAVRAAYAAIGAEEVSAQASSSSAHRVVIGAPKSGWSTITDSTRFTVDLGVAAAIAQHLGPKARVLAVGIRGSSNYGKAASKAFGAWPSKPPSSGKPSALHKVIDKLGKDLLPRPWELDERPGTTLAFDLGRAKRTPGPFKSNTAKDLLADEQGAQVDATWWINNNALNRRYAEAEVALDGLRTPFGWQTALDSMMHTLHSHSQKLERGSAKLFLRLADKALDGVTTANIVDKWEVSVGKGFWSFVPFSTALTCALVASDEKAWRRFTSAVMPEHRDRIGLAIWRRTPEAIAGLPPKVRAWLEQDFAPRDILAWVKTVAKDDAFFHSAAELAALHEDDLALERIFRDARKDTYLAQRLNHAAYTFVREGNFRAALLLFDRLIDLPAEDLSVFANALYAVQRDNNKLKVDRERGPRYIAAAAPHAEDNPPIYINIACVEQELGNRDKVFAALEAAKRHKLKSELAELRDAALFKSLRKDPAFAKLVGATR